MTSPTTSLALAAADRRARMLKARAPKPQPSTSTEVELVKLEERQKFRRLINPGITRPDSAGQAKASLKILLTLAENLLREPDNPKYQKFRCSNDTIKRNLIDVTGALEYAIELGFQPKVQDLEPYYVFNPWNTRLLRIGAEILKDYVDSEDEKAGREEVREKVKQAEEQAHVHELKVRILKDRKATAVRSASESPPAPIPISPVRSDGPQFSGNQPGTQRPRARVMTLSDLRAQQERPEDKRLEDQMHGMKLAD